MISDSTDAIVATIGVGTGPLGVAYDASAGEVFVANVNSDNVSVISDRSDTVVASVGVGSGPYAIAFDPTTSEAFVANINSYNVSVISDANNNVTATLTVGTEPNAVAYDAVKDEVFVANYASNNVSIINVSTDSVDATVDVGTYPDAVVYDSATAEVFVADFGSDDVRAISDTNDSVASVATVGYEPDGLAYDPGTNEIFVANYGSNNVSVVGGVNDLVTSTFGAGDGPQAIVYDSGFREMFVANYGSNNVSFIAAAGEISATFSVDTTLLLQTATRSVDVSQLVNVTGRGYGSSLALVSFKLGSVNVSCTRAIIGTCTGGALKTDATGSFLAQVPVPLVASSGNYTLNATDASGNTASENVTVFTAPTTTVPTAAPTDLDSGQTAVIAVAASFGSGSFDYAWVGLPPGCSASAPSFNCTPGAAGNYSISVRATDSNGVSVTSGVLILVVYQDPAVLTPVASVGSGHVDAGQLVAFSTTANGGTRSYASYSWKGLPVGCSGTAAVVSCSGAGLPEGTYAISVAVADSNAERSPSSGVLSFAVMPDPTIATPSSTPASVDAGQPVIFSGVPAGGSGEYSSFEWIGLPTGCSGTTDPLHCTSSSPGIFTVQLQVTDSNDCNHSPFRTA